MSAVKGQFADCPFLSLANINKVFDIIAVLIRLK